VACTCLKTEPRLNQGRILKTSKQNLLGFVKKSTKLWILKDFAISSVLFASHLFFLKKKKKFTNQPNCVENLFGCEIKCDFFN
jgi:hypothetical protein